MKKLIIGLVFLFSVSLLFSSMVIAGMDSADSFSLKNFSEKQKQEWKGLQEKLQNEYHTCIEHCGNKTECINKCQKAFEGRLKNGYNKVLSRTTAPVNDIELSPACPFCGMDRKKFAFSRVFIQYDDGSVFGACSLHCAAIDMAINIDKAPFRIWVGDYNTRELIDAEKGFWVIGGKKMGVMTKRAKWAFGTKTEAERFIQQFGGELSGFEGAAKAAYEDMYQDTRMIREKRKMKRMRMKKSQK